ncbi:hypothetical protein Glove_372g17 [Diversispora epigaea]|uniref:Uncharacterized protein n=1 Tax=Diversispora epigaea TaxID=1348612 RepID=A0A397H9J9_9GLOM|nr:hypothetical protein Glove_372g17 [Diversispora epigaea]
MYRTSDIVDSFQTHHIIHIPIICIDRCLEDSPTKVEREFDDSIRNFYKIVGKSLNDVLEMDIMKMVDNKYMNHSKIENDPLN